MQVRTGRSLSKLKILIIAVDRLCGLTIRVSYRSRGPGFDSRHYQIFWKVVGLGQGPLILVSTIEELLGRNSKGPGLETWEYGCEDLLRWPHHTLYPQKLALTSPTSSGRLVRLVCSRTKATEFSFSLSNCCKTLGKFLQGNMEEMVF
jgi:hypothetical protein